MYLPPHMRGMPVASLRRGLRETHVPLEAMSAENRAIYEARQREFAAQFRDWLDDVEPTPTPAPVPVPQIKGFNLESTVLAVMRAEPHPWGSGELADILGKSSSTIINVLRRLTRRRAVRLWTTGKLEYRKWVVV